MRAAIAAQFGDDLSVEVWEGEPFQQSGVLDQMRSTVRTFSLVVNLLAVLLLSLVLSGPLTDLEMPIFRGVTAADLGGSVMSPAAMLVGVAAALGVGGLMGVLPLFSALATPIAEGIRD